MFISASVVPINTDKIIYGEVQKPLDKAFTNSKAVNTTIPLPLCESVCASFRERLRRCAPMKNKDILNSSESQQM